MEPEDTKKSFNLQKVIILPYLDWVREVLKKNNESVSMLIPRGGGHSGPIQGVR